LITNDNETLAGKVYVEKLEWYFVLKSVVLRIFYLRLV
jgi:hypothetical protein